MSALRDSGITLLREAKRVPYEDAFLIGDLLTSRITVLSGEPKAGKTLLAVGMVTALLNGDPEFLGLRVHRNMQHVTFGLTDDGATEELYERFLGAVDPDSITSFVMDDTGSADYWTNLAKDLKESGTELFVLDNILGSLAVGDDIAASTTAATVVRNLRPIAQAGIPVLAITHTPKGATEGLTVASSPIGGRAIAGGARGIVVLRYSNKHGRVIETAINRARVDLRLNVEVRRLAEDSDVPVWTLREPKATPTSGKRVRSRRADSAETARQITERAVAEQPPVASLRALADLYAEEYGWSAHHARRKLAPLVRYDASTGWTRV